MTATNRFVTVQTRCIATTPFNNPLYNAVDFGEVVYIFPEGTIRPSIYDSPRIEGAIVGKLQELHYDPRSDYIIIAGTIILTVHAVAAIATHYGKFRALLFDAIDGRYKAKVLGDIYYGGIGDGETEENSGRIERIKRRDFD